MPTEYETKVLNIDVKEVISKLEKLGAKKVLDCIYKRYVFDLGGDEWIRVRTDGCETTLTYKKRQGSGISDVEEIETQVSDFDDAVAIFDKIPYKNKYYRENVRIMYIFEGLEFCIDTLPHIPTYLEIEGCSEAEVKKGLKLLEFEGKDVGNLFLKELYKLYNIELN